MVNDQNSAVSTMFTTQAMNAYFQRSTLHHNTLRIIELLQEGLTTQEVANRLRITKRAVTQVQKMYSIK